MKRLIEKYVPSADLTLEPMGVVLALLVTLAGFYTIVSGLSALLTALYRWGLSALV